MGELTHDKHVGDRDAASNDKKAIKHEFKEAFTSEVKQIALMATMLIPGLGEGAMAANLAKVGVQGGVKAGGEAGMKDGVEAGTKAGERGGVMTRLQDILTKDPAKADDLLSQLETSLRVLNRQGTPEENKAFFKHVAKELAKAAAERGGDEVKDEVEPSEVQGQIDAMQAGGGQGQIADLLRQLQDLKGQVRDLLAAA